MAHMAKIVVLGATGYAGKLAAEALVKRGIRPVLAARTESKLKPLAAELGDLPYQLADASSVDSVKALVDAGDVLVTTVGPFNRLGVTVAQAAAEQGAHYVDSTGEVGFVRNLRDRLDRQAKANGAVMLPAFGNDYVPGILAAGFAMRDGREQVRSLEVGYFISGEPSGTTDMSQGTRKTMMEGLTLPSLVWSDGHIVERRTGSTTRTFTIHHKPRPSILASGTEVLFLPGDFPQLDNVTVYNGWAPDAARFMPVVSAVVNGVAATGLGRMLLAKATERMEGPEGGPDAAARARTGLQTVAIARDAAGQVLADALVEGPNGYTITAELMAWAAIELANGNFEGTGVIGPIEAFGFDKLAAASAEMGMTRTN